MDNVCHTLVGAAMGEAGLKRLSPRGNVALMIAANIPDLDALVFLTGTPSVSFRRGWTHGIVAQAVLPILLTGAIVWFDRWRAARTGKRTLVRPLPLLLLCYAGVLSHVFLDYLNNYGIRLLMPFSGRWFYGDAVFILDPWLWLMLGIGVMWTRRGHSVRPARVGLMLACIYIGAMLWLATTARRIVLDAWVMAHGAAPRDLMVGPVPIDPLTRQIIVDAGDHYETGSLHLWPRRVRFDRDVTRKNDDIPVVAMAREDPAVRAVLVWSRFPQWTVLPEGNASLVTLRDMRFGDRVGVARATVK